MDLGLAKIVQAPSNGEDPSISAVRSEANEVKASEICHTPTNWECLMESRIRVPRIGSEEAHGSKMPQALNNGDCILRVQWRISWAFQDQL